MLAPKCRAGVGHERLMGRLASWTSIYAADSAIRTARFSNVVSKGANAPRIPPSDCDLSCSLRRRDIWLLFRNCTSRPRFANMIFVAEDRIEGQYACAIEPVPIQ